MSELIAIAVKCQHPWMKGTRMRWRRPQFQYLGPRNAGSGWWGGTGKQKFGVLLRTDGRTDERTNGRMRMWQLAGTVTRIHTRIVQEQTETSQRRPDVGFVGYPIHCESVLERPAY